METRNKTKKSKASEKKSYPERTTESLQASSTKNLRHTASGARSLKHRSAPTEKESSLPKAITLMEGPTAKKVSRPLPRRSLIKETIIPGSSKGLRTTSRPRPKPGTQVPIIKSTKCPKNRIVIVNKPTISKVKASSSVPQLAADSLHQCFSRIHTEKTAESRKNVESKKIAERKKNAQRNKEDEDLLRVLDPTRPKTNLRSPSNSEEKINNKNGDTEKPPRTENANLKLGLNSLITSTESNISLHYFQSLQFDLSRNEIHYISDNDFPKTVSQPSLKSPKKMKSIIKKKTKFDSVIFDETSERIYIDTVSACKIANGRYMYYTKENGAPVTELDSYLWLTLEQMAPTENLLNDFWKNLRVVEAITELRDWLNFPNFFTIPNQMLTKHLPLRKFNGLPPRMQVKKHLLMLSATNRHNRTDRMWHQAKNCLIMELIYERRTQQLKNLEDWQKDINAKSQIWISVQNLADFEPSPKEYVYINDYISYTIDIPNEPESSCGCKECSIGNCCFTKTGLAYKNRINIAPLGTTIVECNSKCPCKTECPNRMVQYGPVVKIEIFRKIQAAGMWGIRTKENIPQGQFVFEFIGEIITREDARVRSELYNILGYTHHLIDLDYNGWETPFTIDPTKYGNAARFLNHSCESNLVAYAVFIENSSPDLPRIALFAARNIRSSEELTFDFFRPGVWEVKQKPKIPQPITDAVSTEAAKSRNRCTNKPCRRFLSFDKN